METNTHTSDQNTPYLDTYAFEKISLREPSEWIMEQVGKGKEVGQWLDGFRIHGKTKRPVAEVETLWEAISFFSQGNIDYLVVENTAYALPADGKLVLQSTAKGESIEVPNADTLSAFAINIYAKYFVALEKLSEAIALFSAALKKDTNFCEPYNNLGQLLWKTGKQREAFTLFTQALSKNPHLLTAQLNFFEAGMDLEEYASILNVIEYLEEAIPECIEFKYYKAICNHRLGEHEKAKTILNHILQLQPNDEEAKLLLQNYA